MQNLASATPLLSQSRRFEVSQLFYSSKTLPPITRSNSVEFVPFLRERDKLGRLCGVAASTARHSFEGQLAQSRLFDQQPENKLASTQQWKVNRAVQSFFKKIDMEAKELARSQFVPRKIILKIDRVPKDTWQNDHQYDVESALNQIKTKSKSCRIKQEPAISSPIKNSKINNKFPQNKSQLKQKPLRNNSTLQKKSSNPIPTNPTKSPKKQPQPQIHKKSQSLIGSLKVKLNPQQPQYKRYKQQKEASLKIFEDYEEGHEKFREKMKASKLIAYNIKKQLQLD